jgi:hypothetical protein
MQEEIDLNFVKRVGFGAASIYSARSLRKLFAGMQHQETRSVGGMIGHGAIGTVFVSMALAGASLFSAAFAISGATTPRELSYKVQRGIRWLAPSLTQTNDTMTRGKDNDASDPILREFVTEVVQELNKLQQDELDNPHQPSRAGQTLSKSFKEAFPFTRSA